MMITSLIHIFLISTFSHVAEAGAESLSFLLKDSWIVENTSGFTESPSLAVDSNGNAFFVASTNSPDVLDHEAIGLNDYIVGKLNSSLEIQWSQRYGVQDYYYYPSGICLSQSHAFVMGSKTQSQDYIFVSKHSTADSPDRLWLAYDPTNYGAPLGEYTLLPMKCSTDNDENVYISAIVYYIIYDFYTFLMIKFNSNGEFQYSQPVASNGYYQYTQSKPLVHDEVVYYAGVRYVAEESLSSILLFTFSSDSGSLLDTFTLYANDTTPIVHDICINQQTNHLYVVGKIDSNLMVGKYDLDGNQVWFSTLGNGSFSTTSIASCADDNILIVGTVIGALDGFTTIDDNSDVYTAAFSSTTGDLLSIYQAVLPDAQTIPNGAAGYHNNLIYASGAYIVTQDQEYMQYTMLALTISVDENDDEPCTQNYQYAFASRNDNKAAFTEYFLVDDYISCTLQSTQKWKLNIDSRLLPIDGSIVVLGRALNSLPDAVESNDWVLVSTLADASSLRLYSLLTDNLTGLVKGAIFQDGLKLYHVYKIQSCSAWSYQGQLTSISAYDANISGKYMTLRDINTVLQPMSSGRRK